MHPVAGASCVATVIVFFGVVYALVLTVADVGGRVGGAARCSVLDACLLSSGLRSPKSTRAKCMRTAQVLILSALAVVLLWV